MTLLPWNWLKMRVSAKKVLWLLTSFRWNVEMCRACPWSSWTIPADIVVETWVKNCTARFYNHSAEMRSSFIKSNFKFSLQKHHFVYAYEVIIKYYLNFVTCFYFSLALIRWNSSHCHLIELFKSKETCKGKIWFKQRLKNCMAKNDFRVTSTFKILYEKRWVLWENI